MTTLAPMDPRLARLRAALDAFQATDAARPRTVLPSDPAAPPPLRAAVALILREGVELELLLIKRAISERDPWSGHMALPGGRRDPADVSLLATAVRETAEETGITLDPDRRFLGPLPELAPHTPRIPPLVIAPFVFGAEPGVSARPDPREVERALWVSLAELRDPSCRETVQISLPGGPRPFPAFRVGGEVVWGLTYRILDRFLRVWP